MATMQKFRPAVKTPTLNKQQMEFLQTFPNATESRTQSEKFVQRLLAVIISHITHINKMFPDEYYENRKLSGLPVKILKYEKEDKRRPEDLKQLLNWMKGAYDALTKRYLKTLLFGVSTSDMELGEVIESLTFNFSYTEDGTICMENPDGTNKQLINDKKSLENIINSTISLVENSVVLLADGLYADKTIRLSMKLHYTEDTPENYEPPHFQPAIHKKFTFPSKPSCLKLGEVDTPYHGVGVSLKTAENDKFKSKNISPNKEPIPEEIDEDTINIGTESINNDVQTMVTDSDEDDSFVPAISPAYPVSGVSTTGSRATLPHEGYVRCVCDNDKLDGVLIQCTLCQLWQHAKCFGVLDEKLLKNHYCELCASHDASKCTDPYFIQQKSSAEKILKALYRNALILLSEERKMDSQLLQQYLNISSAIVNKIITKLKSNGIITGGNTKRAFFTVNRNKLKENVLLEFHYRQPDNDVITATKAMKGLLHTDTDNKSKSPEIIELEPEPDVFVPPVRRKRERSVTKKSEPITSVGPKSKRFKGSDSKANQK